MADQSLFEKLLSSGLTSEQASQIVDAESAANAASDADETNRALTEMNRVAKTQGNVKLGDKLTAEQIEKLQSNTGESRKLRGSFKTANTYPAGNLLEGRIQQPIHERPHITKIIQNPDAVFSKLENTINPDAVRRSVQLAELAGTAGRTLAKGVRLTPGVAASEALLNPTQIDETESDIQKNREQLALEKGGEAAKTIIKNLHPDNQIFRSNVPNSTGLLAGLSEQAEATSPGSGEGWRRISTGETELPTPANLANFKEEKPPMGMAESLKARSEIEDTSVPTYFPEDEGDESTSRQLAKQSTASLPGTTKDKLNVTKALEGTAKEKRSIMDAYQDALARRGGMQLVSDIGKASAQIGAGLAGGVGPGLSIAAPKMDTSIYDSISKRAEDSIKDFAIEKQLKDEEALKDPNSPYSKFMRDFLVKKLNVNPKLLEGLPGHEMDKILGAVIKKEEAEAKRIDARAKMAEAHQKHQENLDKRTSERYGRQFKAAFDNANDKLKGGAVGKAANEVRQIESIEALIKIDDPTRAKEELDKLSDQMLSEMARGVDRLISGGASTKYGTEKMDPPTLRRFIAKNWQKLKNEPVGAGGSSFVENWAKLLEREKGVRQNIIADNLNKSMLGLREAYEKSPEYRELIETNLNTLNTDGAAVFGIDKVAEAPEGSKPNSIKIVKTPAGIVKVYKVDSTGKKMNKITDENQLRKYR
jgi:hypothetical protein